jgi:hypothetical protein
MEPACIFSAPSKQKCVVYVISPRFWHGNENIGWKNFQYRVGSDVKKRKTPVIGWSRVSRCHILSSTWVEKTLKFRDLWFIKGCGNLDTSYMYYDNMGNSCQLVIQPYLRWRGFSDVFCRCVIIHTISSIWCIIASCSLVFSHVLHKIITTHVNTFEGVINILKANFIKML